jgi:hypothetical protein
MKATGFRTKTPFKKMCAGALKLGSGSLRQTPLLQSPAYITRKNI